MIGRLRGSVMLMLAVASLAGAQATPELPRAVPVSTIPAATRVIAVPAGGDVQAALASARGGDAIELACGARYTGAWTLPARGADTGWVDVRASCHALLPAGRMTPNVAATFHLPVLLSDGSNRPIVGTVAGTNHYRLLGLELLPGTAGLTALVELGSDAQTVAATIPRAIILDRLYLHGLPAGSLRRCVALNSAWTAIVNSTCTEVHEPGSDNQAIMGWTGPGPYLLQNNRLEAVSEVVMFGGGDPRIVGLRPSDVSVLGNHLTRPVAWRGTWAVKNLFELKNASRVLVEGNVLENNWIAAQDGAGVVLKSTNQEGTCPWCGTTDVTFRWNIVRNTGGAFNLAAAPEANPVVPLARVAVTDNLIANVNVAPFGGVGTLFMVQGGVADLSIDRNTGVTAGNVGTLYFPSFGAPPVVRFSFRNNLMTAGTNYGVYGGNTGGGTVALAMYAPDGKVSGNLFGGMNQFGLEFYAPGYPPGNRFVAQTSDLGFRDVAAGDFMRTTSDSAGVDLPRLLAMTATALGGGAVAPPTPPAPVPPEGPTITLPQLRAAIAALDKVVSPAGRENAATKAALAPVAVYLHALLGAVVAP